jgi:hypothetical protein
VVGTITSLPPREPRDHGVLHPGLWTSSRCCATAQRVDVEHTDVSATRLDDPQRSQHL